MADADDKIDELYQLPLGEFTPARNALAKELGEGGVKKLEKLRQVSKKNGYAFGFSMEFDDAAAYQGYNDHPEHVRFVKEWWMPEVEEFLEIDYERL